MRRAIAVVVAAAVALGLLVAPASAVQNRRADDCTQFWNGGSLVDLCVTVGYEWRPGIKGVRRAQVRLDWSRFIFAAARIPAVTIQHRGHVESHADVASASLLDSSAGKWRSARGVYVWGEVNPYASSKQLFVLDPRLD